jgi:hypothetical protein
MFSWVPATLKQSTTTRARLKQSIGPLHQEPDSLDSQLFMNNAEIKDLCIPESFNTHFLH